MAWVTIANVRGPRGYQGEGVATSFRFRSLADLPSLNVDDWVGIDYIGLYPVLSESIIGRPKGTAGFAFINIEPIGSGGSLVKWTEYSGARRTFERIVSSTVGSRTEWKLTSTPNRVGHHQLSQPGNSALTDTEPSRHVREPVMFFSTIDTWELVFKNHNDQTRTNYGDLSFYEIFISKRKREANGEYGPNFETAPVSLGVPEVTGSGSSRAYRIFDIHYQLEANTDYILSYSYDTPGGTPNHMGIGGSYLGINPAGRNSMDVANAWSQYTPLDVYIKPTMSPDAPYMAFPGSSSETGLHTDYPLRDCWSWRYAEAHGAIPAMLGMSGSTLSTWNAGGHYIWTKMNVSAPVDKVVGNPGSNDLYGGATLAQMQERFIEFARLVRQYLGGSFEATDVFPRRVESPEVRAARLAFNAWLRTLPARILRVYDRASAVTGPDGFMRPDFDSGDLTHLNSYGQFIMLSSMLSGNPRPEELPGIAIFLDTDGVPYF